MTSLRVITGFSHHEADPLRRQHGRRGVLLLVILSMLTLFLMLGAAYLVTATRAREAARAYARLTFGGDEARVPHGRLLDAVLLRVVRGGAAPTGPGGLSPFESVLADKYGTVALSGTASGFTPVVVGGGTSTVLVGTLQLLTNVSATDLNGRLLTFCEPGRPVTTHRIIRAQPTGSNTNTPANQFTLAIDSPRRPGPFVYPQASSRVIVNGREFDNSSGNEPWDGFDAANAFLVRLQPGTTISTSTVSRFSYLTSSTFCSGTMAALITAGKPYDYDNDLIPDAADNDNDGAYDGVFLDFGLPDASDIHGNVVRLRASVLIVDLDGRFNVNAHGSLAPLVYPASHPGWPSVTVVPGLTSAPLGSGYGPAEIHANLANGIEPRSPSAAAPRLFDTSWMTVGTTTSTAAINGSEHVSENPKTMLFVGGTSGQNTASNTRPMQRGKRPLNSRFSLNADTDRLAALEGKYGERTPAAWISGTYTLIGSESGTYPYARPGQRNLDDPSSYTATRRVPYSAANQYVNYGVPPVWWVDGTAPAVTGSNFNWGTAISGTVASTNVPLPPPRGIFNSPPDLHGRMKTLTLAATGQAIVPSMAFAKPEWPTTGALVTTGSDQMRETQDDPYEIQLDTRRGYGGWLHDPRTGGLTVGSLFDNPFTASELEPVLRPYDIDTNRLPPRLAAILGSVAEESRLKITTDSWDTTAITGPAAAALATWLNGATTGSLYGVTPASGIIGGEVARGERFDLNRPLAAADSSNTGYSPASLYNLQRQAYCKDLYTLLVALAPAAPPQQLAQWAANVAEFRDADSRITPFEYDVNPANGWSVDGDVRTDEGGDRAVVWGVERPEILIREAAAWRNVGTKGMGGWFVLHRPWNAMASGSTASIAAEPCDYAIDTLSGGTTGRPQNIVNLGKKSSGDLYSGTNARYVDVSGTTTYPIWRVRIVAGGPPSYVRFDTNDATLGDIVDPAMTSGLTPKMAADSTITFVSGPSIVTGSLPLGSVTLDTSGTTPSATQGARTMPGLRALAASGNATLYLERLSDPSLAITATSTIPGTSITGSAVWHGTASGTTPVQYVVVDSAAVVVNDTSGSINFNGTRTTRTTNGTNTDFWRLPSATSVTANNGGQLAVPGALSTGSTAWLPWPNRPFVSSAELMLVPQGNALEILQHYRTLTPTESGAVGLGRGAPVPLALLFDAVHVPTRFAGIHETYTHDLSAQTKIFNTVSTVNQLSSFREPGRVNLNTVTCVDVWNAVVAGPLNSPLETATNAKFAALQDPKPAQSLYQMLTLSGTGATIVTDTDTMLAAMKGRNPLHGIYTATRLANTVTTRSNVFGVWVTLRESVDNDPDSVKIRRAFYILDRSIPVGFEPGQDHNVWDCVRVRRIIE